MILRWSRLGWTIVIRIDNAERVLASEIRGRQLVDVGEMFMFWLVI